MDQSLLVRLLGQSPVYDIQSQTNFEDVCRRIIDIREKLCAEAEHSVKVGPIYGCCTFEEVFLRFLTILTHKRPLPNAPDFSVNKLNVWLCQMETLTQLYEAFLERDVTEM